MAPSMDPRERTSETERRHATVLFADITGFTTLSEESEDEEVYAIITGLLMRIDGIARKHGGSVDKYMGDAIMATFGVPHALEEASKAAVNAAIEMMLEVKHYNEERRLEKPLDLHIGINSGMLISGDVSGPVLREFAVMGDTVNTAARLEGASPSGSVYVGEATWRETRDDFEYRTLPPLELKGKKAAVQAYELVSREICAERRPMRSGRRLYAPFVERKAELAQVEDRVVAAAQGEGGIVTVMGDAGIGKSRLLLELTASRRCAGVRFLKGRSVAQGSRLSHHPFADLLRDWSDSRSLPREEAAAALADALADLLGSDAPEAIPFALTLAGLPVHAPHAARLRGIEGEALEKLVLRTTKRILEALAAREPLVLIFEDVHWADASSVRLIEQILGLVERSPILFVLVGRPDHAQTAGHLQDLARELHSERHRHVELNPLGEDACRRLIEHFFRDSDAPGTVRAHIAERAEGNPLYVEEVIRSLIDTGALVQREGVLRLGASGAGEIRIPETIREVVMTRIDRLEARQRQLLQVLAVVGRSIPDGLVEALVGGEERLDDDLAHLGELLLLVEEPGGYVFRHALIREVAYDSILKTERPAMHQRVAEAIEEISSPSEGGVAATLAYHFGLADANESAEHYLFQAGEEAARSAASDEALQFFQEALDRYHQRHGDGGDPQKRAALEKNIALAYHVRGDLEAGDHFTRALALMGERPPKTADELRFLSTLVRVVRDLYRGRIPRRRPAADEQQQEVIALMTYRAEAQTTGDPKRFLFDTMETHRVLNRVDPRSVRGGGGLIAGLVGVFSFGGMSFSLGERTLRFAEPVVDADDVAERIMLGLMGLTHHFLAGDWDPRHHIDPDLISEGMRTGRFGRLWHVTNYLGLVAEQSIYRGEFADAADRIESVSKIEELFDYRLARSTHQYTRAVLLATQGRLTEARDAFTDHYTHNREDNLNLLALSERARIHALLGDRDAAHEDLRAARAIVERVGVLSPYLKTPLIVPYYLSNLARSQLLVDLIEVERSLAEGGRPRARAYARTAKRSGREAARLAKRVSWRRPEVSRLRGSLAWVCGRPDHAVARWE